MRNGWRVSGILMVALVVVFLTGATFQQTEAERQDPQLMGILTEPVPMSVITNGAPIVAQAGPRWGNWNTINGAITSAPSVTSAGINNVFMFARSERGTLVWSRWDGRSWSPFAELSGARLASAPSCASWGDSRTLRLSCFAVLEGSNALRHLYYIDGSWFGWENLGGDLRSAPAAVSWDFNVVSAFGRDRSGQMVQKWYNGRSWSDWVPQGGTLTSAPACASLREPPHRVDCAVRGNNNVLYTKTWEAGAGKGWGAWVELGGGVTSAPGIAAWGANRRSIFYRGDNGMMLHRFWDGTRWQGPEDLGGPISSSPACTAPQTNRIECYAQGIDAAYNAGPAIIQRVWGQ